MLDLGSLVVKSLNTVSGDPLTEIASNIEATTEPIEDDELQCATEDAADSDVASPASTRSPARSPDPCPAAGPPASLHEAQLATQL